MRATKFMSPVYLLCVLVLSGGVMPRESAAATPDGFPPSREHDCDALEGAAFGLCNAFCEAQDCDEQWQPSCDVLRNNFFAQTGFSAFPCEDIEVTRTPTFTAAREATATRTRTDTRTPEGGIGEATATRTRTATRTPEGGIGEATATPTSSLAATATRTRTPEANQPTATKTKESEDEVCDHLDGAALGLCTAFCEAHDCPSVTNPSCEVLRANYKRETGSSVFPCEEQSGPPTATPSPGACMCDCAGDGKVNIEDLTRAVRILLGTMPIDACQGLAQRASHVTIQDLVMAVRQALSGCS